MPPSPSTSVSLPTIYAAPSPTRGCWGRRESSLIESRRRWCGASRRCCEEVEAGEFPWHLSDEDVHTAVERRLKELVGDVALKLHTGRSRNDQVALDLHLFARDAAERIRCGRSSPRCGRSSGWQRRTRTSFYPDTPTFSARSRSCSPTTCSPTSRRCSRDLRRLEAAREAASVSPLGAAALGGTPHPVDPRLTAEELGMEPFTNSLDAVSERDFVLDLLYACAVLGVHLSRLGEEWVLWTSAEFGFATLGDAYSSGSSIMPQKKNPDAYELMRGKTGRLIGDLNGVLITLKRSPTRLLERPPGGQRTSLRRGRLRARHARRPARDARARRASTEYGWSEAAGGFALATELADFLAAEGVPFREAHHAVGRLVRRCEELGVSLEEVPQDELAAAHPALSEVPEGLLTPRGSVRNKRSAGSTAPASVDEQLRQAKAFLETDEGPRLLSEGSDRCG